MRLLLGCGLLLLLSACGASGPGKTVADACIAEVNQRLAGKTFELDAAKLVASAEPEDADKGIWHVSSQVVFDRGLGTEFSQNMKCKARFENGSASVLSLEFIWALKDLNLDDKGS